MTNFSRQWADEFELPDGSIATCAADVDRYLRESGAAMSSDYSERHFKDMALRKNKARKEELFAEFIKNYKRMIWNE